MFRRRPPQQHPNIEQPAAASQSEGPVFNGDDDNGNGGGGGPSFCNTSYQLAWGRDIYDAPPPPPPRITGYGGMSGGFTAAQKKELERQIKICKYMMDSAPVPSQLLSTSSSTRYPVSLSAYSELKFSSGSDPEPWRCRRTDGKKWRCSRNAAPDHKYCERHAHKTKSRSRKHVEFQPPNPTPNHSQPPVSLGNKIPQFPTMGSAGPYHLQTGGMDCITKGRGATAAVSIYNQQWQQLMQSSSNGHGPLSLLPYLENAGCQTLEYHQPDKKYCNTVANAEMGTLQGNINTYMMQGTRPLIDAWLNVGKGGLGESSKEVSGSNSMRLPLCSLSLPTPGEDEMGEDTSIGLMMNAERESEDLRKSQYDNSVSWMGTPPGGPLGEALCLGLASNEKGFSNLVSPHCYSNSTTTSSCSRSSCEDGIGSQAFNFIG